MNHYAGIDVSLECSSVCVVDANGKILREAKVASEPEALIAWFRSSGFDLERIGLEAGPLSQWLFAAMREAGLAVELLETRHGRKAFEAMPVKAERNDARGTDRGACGGPSASSSDRQGTAGGASGAADRVRSFREAGTQAGALRHADTAADVDAGGRPDRGADLCQRDRRSRAVQIVEAGRSPFRVDPEEVSIRRDRLHRPDQQDQRQVGAHGALRGRPCHAEET